MLTELEANAKACELSKTSRYPVSVWFADPQTGWDYGIRETGKGVVSTTALAQLSASRQRDILGFENSSASRRLQLDTTGAAVASWLCGKE